MQSTGQTSTQDRSFVSIHGSAMTYVTSSSASICALAAYPRVYPQGYAGLGVFVAETLEFRVDASVDPEGG